MGAVLGRTVATGTVAGVVAGVLTYPAMWIYSQFDDRTGPGTPVTVGEIGLGLIVLLMWAAVVGAPAGAVLGLPAGLLLGLLRPVLAGHPTRCRVAGALVIGGVLGAYTATLAALGTSEVWLVLLGASPVVTGVVVGAWRGPVLIDGPRSREPAQS